MEGIGSRHYQDRIMAALYQRAKTVASRYVRTGAGEHPLTLKLDALLTSKRWGYPLMLLLLVLVFWITLVGADYPSGLLALFFSWAENSLGHLLQMGGLPSELQDFLISGVFRTAAWVVAVMLPPMAIFFPLFTFLEDLGYLPRVAFNLDNFFKRAGAHGKQALTMAMGFGCNTAGVIGCRMIDSPWERLIAILTNNFSPATAAIRPS